MRRNTLSSLKDKYFMSITILWCRHWSQQIILPYNLQFYTIDLTLSTLLIYFSNSQLVPNFGSSPTILCINTIINWYLYHCSSKVPNIFISIVPKKWLSVPQKKKKKKINHQSLKFKKNLHFIWAFIFLSLFPLFSLYKVCTKSH